MPIMYLILSCVLAQFILQSPSDLLGFVAAYSQSSPTCGTRVFGTSTQGVKIEHGHGGTFQSFTMSGSGAANDCAISDDQSRVIFAGDVAYVYYFSAGAYSPSSNILGPMGDQCQQALLTQDMQLLFLLWTSGTIDVCVDSNGVLPYVKISSLTGFPTSVSKIMLVSTSSHDLLVVLGSYNVVNRYRTINTVYSGFTQIESVTVSSGSLLEVAVDRPGTTLAFATSLNTVQIYIGSSGPYNLQQVITTAPTVLTASSRMKFSYNGNLLGVFGTSDLILYSKNSSGLFQFFQKITGVAVGTMLLCNDRIELYSGNVRKNYVACPTNYAFAGNCVATCPVGYNPINGAFNYCQQCIYDQELTSCVTSCRATYFQGPTMYCEKCIPPCLTCTSLTACLTCDGFIDGTSCVQNCTYPKANNAVLGICQLCPNFYHYPSKTCFTACPAQTYPYISLFCADCIPPCFTCTTASDCLACQQPLLLTGTKCVTQCPSGLTVNYLNQCVNCPLGCALCKALICTSCKPGLLLHQNTCLGQCPVGHFSFQGQCLSSSSQSVSLQKYNFTGFIFPSSDKIISFYFSQPISSIDFTNTFLVNDSTFLLIADSPTSFQLKRTCQSSIQSSTVAVTVKTLSVSSEGRPFAQSLKYFRLQLDYGCYPAGTVFKTLFGSAQKIINSLYEIDPIARSVVSLLYPVQFAAILPVLESSASHSSPLLLIQNIFGSPFNSRIRTWQSQSKSRRTLLTTRDQYENIPFRPIMYLVSSTVLLALTCLSRQIAPASPNLHTLFQLILQRGIQACYLLLTADCCRSIKRQDSRATAICVSGLLIAISTIGFRLFRKVCFLNSAIKTKDFWHIYPQFSIYNLLMKFRITVYKPLTIWTFCGPQLYQVLLLSLQSTILVAAVILSEWSVIVLTAIVLFLVIYIFFVYITDPFESCTLKVLLPVKQSLFFVVLAMTVIIQILPGYSNTSYEGLGIATSLLILACFLFQLSYCFFLYAFVFTSNHRKNVIDKITQYYRLMLFQGELTQYQLNKLVVAGDLNLASQCSNLPVVLVQVCFFKVEQERTQLQKVQKITINPKWQFYSTQNFKIGRTLKSELTEQDHEKLKLFIRTNFGIFEKATAAIFFSLDQNKYPDGTVITQFEINTCTTTIGANSFSLMKVPTVLLKYI